MAGHMSHLRNCRRQWFGEVKRGHKIIIINIDARELKGGRKIIISIGVGKLGGVQNQ